MSQSSSSVRLNVESTGAMATVGWSGLIAGTLDLAWAVVHTLIRHGSPLGMLRFIAGGLLGADALKGGLGLAMIGLGLHFVIAFGAAAIFYALSSGIPWLVRRPWSSGLLYGIGVWLVMNLVVLRFSAWHATKFPPNNWLPTFVAHLVCVGLPIALITSRRNPPPSWPNESGV